MTAAPAAAAPAPMVKAADNAVLAPVDGAVAYPEIVQMQTRAIIEAAINVNKDLATIGFMITLQMIRSAINATAMYPPAFLVFGISNKITVKMIHTIPASPSLVIDIINVSRNEVWIV